jgi:ubiquinone biosynthesis protein
MAQIHRAVLLSGEEVVVKVQRPNTDTSVRGDIAVMREVTSTLEKRVQRAKEMGLSGMLEEFAQNLYTELDFRNEAYHARLLAHNMRDVPEVRVPAVYEAHSTATVLTMEYMEGIKITEIARREDVAREDIAIDRTVLARAFLRSMNRQVMLDGFFHADPHPGNVLVDPDNGQIIFLDLGMMGTLNRIQRSALLDMMWSLKEHDSQSVTRTILRLTAPAGEIDRRAFEKDVDRMVKRNLVFTDKNPQLSDVTQDAFVLLARHGLRLEPEFTMALKSLVQTEETVRTLAPELSLFDAAIEEIQQVVLEQVNAEVIVSQAKKQMVRSAKDVVLRLPTWQQSAAKWLEQLESGRLTIHVDADDVAEPLEEVEANIDRNVRRLALSLLLVGLLVSLAIASNSPLLSFLPDGVAQLVLIPLALGAILSLIYAAKLVWEAWRSR